MTRWGRALAALASVALGTLVACSGGDSNAPDCDPIAAALVSRIEVKPPTATVNLGDSLQLQAVAYSCAGALGDVKSFTWRSADEATAAVSATGLVKAMKSGGPIAIFAAAQGKEGSSAITAQPVPVFRVTVEPATATVGVGRTSTLTARAFDAQDREIVGRTVEWSSARPSVVTVNENGAVTGVAAGGPVAVTATIEGKSAASQVTVTTIPVNTVVVAPPTSTIGAGTTQQFTATLKDELGNTLTGRAVNWTSSNPTIATIGGATGLATGLRPGTVTITATSEGKTGTAQLTVNIGAPAKLAFVQQPSTVQAGATMTPAVTVEIQDAAGNRVTTSTATVTLSLNNAGGATLGGNTAVAVGGLATFSGLTVSAAGSYSLTAASPGMTSATSNGFTVSPRPATKLAFVQQPTNVVAGANVTPAVTVELQDETGTRVTTSGVSITLALGNNPGSSTLGGTLTQTTTNGVATFPNLTLNKVGTGYTLTASSSGLTGATSAAFNVTPGAATKLVLLTAPCPTFCTAGSPVSPAPRFEIQDANGNRVTTSTATVNVSQASGPGGALSGTTSVAAVGGVATFSNLVFTKTGTFTLSAASTGLTGVTTGSFSIVSGSGSLLSITTTLPTSITSGATLPSVSVQLLDANQNPVTTAGVSVSLSLSAPAGASGTLGGTTTQLTNASGVATFTNVTISASAAAGYRLAAASTGYTPDTSNAFTVVLPTFALTVASSPNGTITSSPGGINCGATCSATFTSGTAVVLTATPSTGFGVGAWTGCDSSTGATCNVTVNAARNVSVTYLPLPSITTATLNDATLGAPYTPVTLGVSGGTSPYTWAIAAGSLPTGMNLSPAGVVSGTPTQSGTFNFSVRVTDAAGQTDTDAFSLLVVAGTVTGASQLGFVVQPTEVRAKTAISPPVQVEVQDPTGTRVTSSTANVVLVFGNSAGGAKLSGNTAKAQAGVATFSDLRVSEPGTGFTLVATAAGLTPDTSTAFRVR